MGTFVQAFTELGTGKKIMKILLIVALAVAAVVAEPEAEAEAAADAWYGYYGYPRYGYKTKWVDGYGYANYGHYVGKREAEADPGFVYTVGYHPPVYGLPLVYTHPVAYANNVCKNEAGAVVPCASPVAVGSGVYNFADAPVGLHPVVPGVAPVAPAAAEADAVVSVEKREAEAEAEAEAAADAWYAYYGRPAYYGYGYGLGGYYGGYAGYYGGYAGYGYYGLGHGYYGGVGCRNGYGAA